MVRNHFTGDGAVMGVTYFKRYRMEIDLSQIGFRPRPLTCGYELVPWSRKLLEAHADVKYRSFCYEIDANVFPCLGDRDGCLRLMNEITRRDTFLSQATWLLRYAEQGRGAVEVVGTIQGIRDRSGVGAVQNLGVIPTHRGRGLGTSLLYQSLLGFQAVGLPRAFLEVTAQNVGALRLYERLGFRIVKTVYKAAEVAYV
jgi:ribosomal protein S18 acetylase RimI-like enzyme